MVFVDVVADICFLCYHTICVYFLVLWVGGRCNFDLNWIIHAFQNSGASQSLATDQWNV